MAASGTQDRQVGASNAGEALIRCLRCDSIGDRRLQDLSRADWLVLLDLLQRRNGLSLLKRRLGRYSRDIAVPEEVLTALRAHGRLLTNRTLLSIAALVKCVRRAQKPLLLLKGIDISRRIYGSFGARPMGDIDILSRPEDVATFHAGLLELGYRTNEPPTPERMADPLWSQTFYAPPQPGAFPIELHWRLGNDAFADAIDMDAVWQRARPLSALAEPDALVMAPEDLLLYLCLHMRHHTFDTPLTHVWDLAEIVDWIGPEFDWSAFWRRAEDWRLTQTVHLAFRQLRDVLGVTHAAVPVDTIPPEIARLLPDVLPNLGLHPSHERVAEPHVAQLFAPAIPVRARMGLIWRTLFAPRAHIAARYNLPARSWRLNAYYLAYWWRLIGNHGGTIRQWLLGDSAVRAQSDRVYGLGEWLEAQSSPKSPGSL